MHHLNNNIQRNSNTGSNTHTLQKPPHWFVVITHSVDCIVPALTFSLTSSLAYDHIQRGQNPFPSPTHWQIKERREGRKLKNTQRLQPMGARRGARCPLRAAHRRVSDEVLVVSGAGSRERALRRA